MMNFSGIIFSSFVRGETIRKHVTGDLDIATKICDVLVSEGVNISLLGFYRNGSDLTSK